MRHSLLIIFIVVLVGPHSFSQPLRDITFDNLQTRSFKVNDREWKIQLPLLEFTANGKTYLTNSNHPLSITITDSTYSARGGKLKITFTNPTKDTVTLTNVIPFGHSGKDAYITGLGDNALSRTHLFLPNHLPVNVIVPDNAWNLGYSSFHLDNEYRLFGLARRDADSFVNALRRRFETVLLPGGSVTFTIYTDIFKGTWQEGLREVFQKRYLYDVGQFDETLYQRKDLQWINKAYVMHLMMAWDKDYFDVQTGQFNFSEFRQRGKRLYGGDDVIGLWPSWPTLGLDQRNQFDLYRDLPGGLAALRQQADSLRANGTKFFIAYNPWDESTRTEGHLQGLASLIQETGADGVVLDTKGESSEELQAAADKVRPGVIMYSEGMAVPKHMPGIVSGRVHNALYYPPMLNLNKFIRPDFAIFRVAEVYKEPIKREYAVAFFNGYGTEINQFAPGHPEWEEEQYVFLGRTSSILRENHSCFVSFDITPIIPTLHDSIWVNEWKSKTKTVYTIYSLKPEGFKGSLLEVNQHADSHYVDLWHHQEKVVTKRGEKWLLEAETEAFSINDLGTNNEGAVDCIAKLPILIKGSILENYLHVECKSGTELRIWKGNPSYGKEYKKLSTGTHKISLPEMIGRYEGKLVVQAFDGDELVDEIVLNIKPGSPRLISKQEKTSPVTKAVPGMVKIARGSFTFRTTNGDEFIPYPKENEGKVFTMATYWMDKHPITNSQFKEFMKATHYTPTDTTNFLKHWKAGEIVKGEEQYPVVYVSYEDAKAYAAWAGKRLPTELEWQYAAQTEKLHEWPWKQLKPVTRKEEPITETLTVTSIEGINPGVCNLGDGKLYSVGAYPKGANAFGLQDLVGCVWQMTNDVYESGSYRYITMKGGSYFKPSSSWWYVQGGPRELHYRQVLLRVSQGFERNGTVGFRCVKDAANK